MPPVPGPFIAEAAPRDVPQQTAALRASLQRIAERTGGLALLSSRRLRQP
ncbi:hypothetical protein WME98_15650 [Sorangium sp. So ce296]